MYKIEKWAIISSGGWRSYLCGGSTLEIGRVGRELELAQPGGQHLAHAGRQPAGLADGHRSDEHPGKKETRILKSIFGSVRCHNQVITGWHISSVRKVIWVDIDLEHSSSYVFASRKQQ